MILSISGTSLQGRMSQSPLFFYLPGENVFLRHMLQAPPEFEHVRLEANILAYLASVFCISGTSHWCFQNGTICPEISPKEDNFVRVVSKEKTSHCVSLRKMVWILQY